MHGMVFRRKDPPDDSGELAGKVLVALAISMPE
jgi:hypothetical protein